MTCKYNEHFKGRAQSCIEESCDDCPIQELIKMKEAKLKKEGIMDDEIFKITDGRGNLIVKRHRLEHESLACGNNRTRRWKILGRGDFPADPKSLDVLRNDAMIQDIENGEVAFIQIRFLYVDFIEKRKSQRKKNREGRRVFSRRKS